MTLVRQPRLYGNATGPLMTGQHSMRARADDERQYGRLRNPIRPSLLRPSTRALAMS